MTERKPSASPNRGKEVVAHLQLRVPESLHEQLRRLSFETRRSQNEIMLEALSQYMEERCRS